MLTIDLHKAESEIGQTTAEQGAAPDRLQLRSFLSSLPAAGKLCVRQPRAVWLRAKLFKWQTQRMMKYLKRVKVFGGSKYELYFSLVFVFLGSLLAPAWSIYWEQKVRVLAWLFVVAIISLLCVVDALRDTRLTGIERLIGKLWRYALIVWTLYLVFWWHSVAPSWLPLGRS